MGAFGVGPYENDDGLDIKDIWEDYIPDNSTEWDSNKVCLFFKRVYYRGKFPVVSDGNSNEIIALAQKFDDSGLELPEELKEKLSHALNLEIQKDRLSEWGDQSRKRSNVLKKIAKMHGVELSKKAKEASSYAAEIESLEHWFENIERVNSLLDKMSIKTIDWVDSIKPEFVQFLEDSTWKFSDESDEDNAAKLGDLRYLAVLWFTFFNLKYKPTEIKAILKKASI